MKKQNKLKIVVILFLLLITTGCTTTLVNDDKQPVKNEKTGQINSKYYLSTNK